MPRGHYANFLYYVAGTVPPCALCRNSYFVDTAMRVLCLLLARKLLLEVTAKYCWHCLYHTIASGNYFLVCVD